MPSESTPRPTETVHQIGERVLAERSIDGRFTADQLQGFILGYTARDTALDAMRGAMAGPDDGCTRPQTIHKLVKLLESGQLVFADPECDKGEWIEALRQISSDLTAALALADKLTAATGETGGVD